MGGNTTAKKTIPEVRKMSDKQMDELKKVQTNLLTELQGLNLQANYFEKKLKG